jgi:hypothetical protein
MLSLIGKGISFIVDFWSKRDATKGAPSILRQFQKSISDARFGG